MSQEQQSERPRHSTRTTARLRGKNTAGEAAKQGKEKHSTAQGTNHKPQITKHVKSSSPQQVVDEIALRE
jgi:hypothetical protein